ncbi:MAG: MBL fold metallo-hydrolase [Nevskiales bacterium]
MRRAGALALALLLAACSDGDGSRIATGGAAPPPSSNGTGNVALADWQPLAAARSQPVPPEVRAAREQILGVDPTNPAEVKLWWYGVSSFIASMGGHLFLFDAWEIVGLHKDYVPIGREELAALKPEAILVGHGHFDHAGDLGYVAGRSGTVVVGSEEICAVAREQAARDGNENNFPCLITGTMSTPTPGTAQAVKLWSDLPEVHILQHIHSAATPELQDPGIPFIHIPELLVYVQHLNTDLQEYQSFVESLDDPQGGTWAYHIRVGDFSLLWHDSTGPINGGNPFAAEVQQALDSFPDCVDVQVGAIVGFNQPLNGLRDPRLYVQHAHPKLSLPSHHDAWAPVIGGGAAGYETAWRAELAQLEHPPELDYLRDPEDYMKARVYRMDEPRWKVATPGSSCAS